jgi:uncharacterized Fe-S cluster-containing radical SAM superfamily protein
MENLFKKTKIFIDKVNRKIENNERQYLIISDFGESSVTGESGFINPLFRIFTPVKPENGRKLNPIYGDDFNLYKDTLMDYPTIVQYKLGKVGVTSWKDYNRLISVHIALCPINCWHCYLEECLKADCSICSVSDYCDKSRQNPSNGLKIKSGWYSAIQILDEFIEQRKSDKSEKNNTNILRISGGEPFLVPYLFLEILKELKNRKLDNEIFVWGETNLLPLAIKGRENFFIPDDILDELSTYSNFCVHPCFHGINANNFSENTGEKIENFEFLFIAFKRLIDAGIDVYPTIGSNVSDPDSIKYFFEEISKIDPLLPLRFYLIEFDLNYEPIKWRRKYVEGYEKIHSWVYDRFQVIDKWNELLYENTGYHYGDIPRHLVPIKKKK